MAKYHQILLAKLGDLKDYEFMGGYTCKNNLEKSNYMRSYESMGVVYPELKKYCECSHWIKQNCYIRNMITKEILVIGNCCIKHFEIKKKCEICKVVHNRSKFNICLGCQKEEQQKDKLRNTVLNFGKYRKFSIAYVEEKDENYLKWIHNEVSKDQDYSSKTNAMKVYKYIENKYEAQNRLIYNKVEDKDPLSLIVISQINNIVNLTLNNDTTVEFALLLKNRLSTHGIEINENKIKREVEYAIKNKSIVFYIVELYKKLNRFEDFNLKHWFIENAIKLHCGKEEYNNLDNNKKVVYTPEQEEYFRRIDV